MDETPKINLNNAEYSDYGEEEDNTGKHSADLIDHFSICSEIWTKRINKDTDRLEKLESKVKLRENELDKRESDIALAEKYITCFEKLINRFTNELSKKGKKVTTDQLIYITKAIDNELRKCENVTKLYDSECQNIGQVAHSLAELCVICDKLYSKVILN